MQEFYNSLTLDIQQNYNVTSPDFSKVIIGSKEPYRWGSSKKKYWLYINEYHTEKGDPFWVASYGVQNEGSFHTFKKNSHLKLNAAEKKQIDRVIKTRNTEIEKERAEVRKKAYLDFMQHWQSSSDFADPTHDYISGKVSIPYQARTLTTGYYAGDLILPMYNSKGEITGWQRLMHKNSVRTFKDDPNINKKYVFGTDMKSNSFLNLKPFKEADRVFITEGYATACSIQEAIEYPVIVAFTANHIANAIRGVREVNPDCFIVVAADLDSSETGQDVAKKAKDKFLNVDYILPVGLENNPDFFDQKRQKPKFDFNDVHVTLGIAELRKQLSFEVKEAPKLKYLGFDESKYYVYSEVSKQIVGLRPDQLKTPFIFRLVSDIDYWTKKYPGDDERLDTDCLLYTSDAADE